MAYTTHSDISVYMGDPTYTSSTKPTEAQVNSIILQIGSEIDAYLRRAGVGTPITDADGLNIVKKYCNYGVCGILGYSRMRNNNPTDNTQPNFFQVEYNKFLKELEKGEGALVDILLSGSSGSNANVMVSNSVIAGLDTAQNIYDSYKGIKFDD